MGLTQNKDILSLQAELIELKIKLAELNSVVFKEDVLQKPDTSWDVVREKRDQLLKDTDWTMTPGATVDQRAWASYRQNLRDLPQTYVNYGLEKIVWPTLPGIAGPNTTPVE